MTISIAAVNARDWLALKPAALDSTLSCGITAVDVRIALPHRGPSKDELALAKRVRDAGLEVRAHAWAGRSNGTSEELSIAGHAEGLDQGKRAAENAALLGAHRYGCNAEHHVWRGRAGTANPKAVDFLSGFLDAFYPANRECHADYLGFPDPAHHYRSIDADGDGDIDTEIPEDEVIRWWRCAAMVYQSDPSAVLRGIERAAQVWRTAEGPLDIDPWVGVGRIDAKLGQVGSEAATKAAYRRCGRVTLYVGNGAIGQLTEGHKGHRPLVALVPQMADEVLA